ncbi:hypothetical protein ACNOYE_21995 [Nannocystaceae bacterium ST9]
MILALALTAWLAPAPEPSPTTLPSAPTSGEPTEPTEPTDGPRTAEPDRRGSSRFTLTGGVAPARNVWPHRQLCDLDPELRPACLMLGADLITGYRWSRVGDEGAGEFTLDRAELGSELVWQPIRWLDAGARVRLEALRSAGPDSLQGIDGNALVVRAWQAFGHVAGHFGPIDVGVRAGLVPERWIEQVEKGYDQRGLGSLGSERRQLFDTADLGVSLTISGWRSLVDLDVAIVNGEGRSQREQNPGKNTTLILSVRPLRLPHRAGPIELALHGVYRDGSLGPASTRSHRAGGATSLRSPWVFAGVEYVRAFGYLDRGDVQADVISAWTTARLAPWGPRHFDPERRFAPWAGLVLGVQHARLDVSLVDAAIDTVSAGLFAELFPTIERNTRRVRLYVAYQWEGFGALAGSLPGAPEAQTTHRVLVTLHAFGLARLHLERHPE